MESSSGKIRQSSYNRAQPRQDQAARRGAQALARTVRAARRADQERASRARRAPADRAGADARAGEPHRGARAVAALRAEVLVVTARVSAPSSPPRRGTPFRIEPERMQTLADTLNVMELRLGRRDRVGRDRRRARLGAQLRDRRGLKRSSRPPPRESRRWTRPLVSPRHRRRDRNPGIPPLPAVHRPPPHPAAHGERAARAHGRTEGLPRAHPGGTPHLRGDPRPTPAPPARRCAGTSPARSGVTASSPPSARKPLEDPPDALAGGAGALLRPARARGFEGTRRRSPASRKCSP